MGQESLLVAHQSQTKLSFHWPYEMVSHTLMTQFGKSLGNLSCILSHGVKSVFMSSLARM